MSDSKKPTLSEIRLLQAQAIHTDEDFTQLLHTDIPYLLDLVERLGILLGWYRDNCPDCDDDNEKYCTPCKEARALLLEIKK